MQVEIFGPILPIVPVENVDEAIKFINDRYFIIIITFPILYIKTFLPKIILCVRCLAVCIAAATQTDK